MSKKLYLYKEKLIEELADYAHDTWAGWVQYMFSQCKLQEDGSVLIPAKLVRRWQRQLNTTYAELPKKEQRSDKEEAIAILEVFSDVLEVFNDTVDTTKLCTILKSKR